MDKLTNGNKVLVIWNRSKPEDIESFVNKLKETVGQNNVSLENSERLSLGGHSDSKFDAVLSNVVAPYNINHSDSYLASIIKIVKPGGLFVLKEKNEGIKLTLKLSGFTDVNQNGETVECKKPNYEVGSSMKLGNKVWKLDNDVESAWSTNQGDDDEVIDSDQLLDEDDLKKPDPGTLKVCSTTGKRKACADCSCGLAEELAGETNTKQEQPKSSCGSCYLGDAFRCASCPYLGMPAFKPGEKVLLADLKPDI